MCTMRGRHGQRVSSSSLHTSSPWMCRARAPRSRTPALSSILWSTAQLARKVPFFTQSALVIAVSHGAALNPQLPGT